MEHAPGRSGKEKLYNHTPRHTHTRAIKCFGFKRGVCVRFVLLFSVSFSSCGDFSLPTLFTLLTLQLALKHFWAGKLKHCLQISISLLPVCGRTFDHTLTKNNFYTVHRELGVGSKKKTGCTYASMPPSKHVHVSDSSSKIQCQRMTYAMVRSFLWKNTHTASHTHSHTQFTHRRQFSFIVSHFLESQCSKCTSAVCISPDCNQGFQSISFCTAKQLYICSCTLAH